VQEGDIRIGGAKTTAVPESGICGYFVDLVRGGKNKIQAFRVSTIKILILLPLGLSIEKKKTFRKTR
jgi:hypothetical protein